MSNFRRRLMMSVKKNKLPSGYTELEYLESTGTQYIDTKINAQTGVSCNLKASYRIVSGNASILSAYTGTSRFYLAHISNPDKYWTLGYGNYYLSNIIPSANKTYEIITNLLENEQSIIIDGVKIVSKNINTNVNLNLTLYLFAMNKNTAAGNYSSSKVYKLELYKNNILVSDYIPVLDADGTPCMYDTISKQTFYNQGTGEFLYKEKSLFNTANLQIGYAISASGVINANSNFNCTEFIPVNKSKYIFSGISGKTSDWNLRIHAYDENKNWIKQILLQSISVGKTLDVNFEINDDTIKYIRVSIANENFTDYSLITLKEIS